MLELSSFWIYNSIWWICTSHHSSYTRLYPWIKSSKGTCLWFFTRAASSFKSEQLRLTKLQKYFSSCEPDVMNFNLGGFKIWIRQKIAITTRYEVYALITWEMMEEEEIIVDSIFCWISGIIWLVTMGNQYDPTG